MIIKEILNRRAVRDYDSKPVPEEYITEIIKAAQFAPTSRNNKAVEFVVVRSQETKDKIFEIVGQDYVKEAPILIVPVSDASKSNTPVPDLALASEMIFLQAISLGLGTAWKNLQPEWEIKVKKLLNIPDGFRVINVIPVGFPKEKTEPHNDSEFSEQKIHQENW